MEQARILHCESDPAWLDSVAQLLGHTASHEVVAVAGTYAEAMDRLTDIGIGSIDANLILMDSSLRGGSMINHPKTIVVEMKRAKLRLPVVGLSERGLALKNLVLGRDYNAELLKEEFVANPDKLLDILDELENPPQNWRSQYVK